MSSPFDRDVWSVLGIPIDNLSVAEAATRIEQAVATRERLSFVTPNVNWLVRALDDDGALKQILRADLSLADGAPIVWLARQVGMPLRERVAGSDLFEYLRHADVQTSLPIKVFFFGGRDGAAEAACARLADEGGRLQPAGWHNPGFGSVADMTTPEIQSKINAADPDFIIVALGAAKGQAWIEANLPHLSAPVIAHLGAVVDFVAGTIHRAPTWISRIGLEWIWRILAEPSLWRRYWRDGRALISLARQRLGPLKKIVSAKTTQQPIDVSQAITTDRVDIIIKGDLTQLGRTCMSAACKTALDEGLPIRIDLDGVNNIDASGLGQIHLLQHALLWRDQNLTLQVPPRLNEALKAASLA